MAFLTFESIMLALKQETRLLVVEGGRVPTHQFKFPAVMLLVAFVALKFAGIVVKPQARIHTRFDFSVAGQAVIPESLLSEIVALSTVVDALKF